MNRKKYPKPEDPKIKKVTDEIERLDNSFLIGQDKILNQHLPLNEEKTRINTLYQSHLREIQQIGEKSVKSPLGRIIENPKKEKRRFDYRLEFEPTTLPLDFSDLQYPTYHPVKISPIIRIVDGVSVISPNDISVMKIPPNINLDQDIDEFLKYRCKNCGTLEAGVEPGVRDYCTKMCRDEARRKQAAIRMKIYRNKHRIEKKDESPKYSKKCEFCGSEFQSTRSDAKTCPNRACRMKKWRSKQISLSRLNLTQL